MSSDPQSIPELLQQRVSATPDKLFLFSEADKRQFTYKEFEAAVMRTARMLAAKGVGYGDVVSLLLPNSVEYVIAYFACWQLGALAGPPEPAADPQRPQRRGLRSLRSRTRFPVTSAAS